MAIAKSFLMKLASGRIGKDIVIKKRGDKTFLSQYPDFSKRVLTEKQLKNNERMEQANYYARGIISDEATRDAALLRLNVTRNKLYTSLVREFFKEMKDTE
ncbi:hypothetical protein [Flavihumibacter sp.]|uniref:hypothetical protein n=1 Tax=Flavihumibacter sp. TaxID=1913981 RepID=UPI002FC8984E